MSSAQAEKWLIFSSRVISGWFEADLLFSMDVVSNLLVDDTPVTLHFYFKKFRDPQSSFLNKTPRVRLFDAMKPVILPSAFFWNSTSAIGNSTEKESLSPGVIARSSI